ncbi:MAG: PTS sugar transporter subunit IIA [Planctomycetes bacterium]|nr:PTS sugar transporter subunit IIA [Planctomycetota bacterium]
MQLTRYLRPAQVKLDLDTRHDPERQAELSPHRYLESLKESVLAELAELLDASGKVGNKSKLLTDLINRERKATTAVGKGIAIPHVRTMQAKDFVIAFARSVEGLDLDAPDKQPVHFFLALVAPPYDDQKYLKVYRRIATLFTDEEVVRELLAAEDVHGIIKTLSRA